MLRSSSGAVVLALACSHSWPILILILIPHPILDRVVASSQAYAKTVDIIGLHYPSDFVDYKVCHSLNKPIWASEESSSYDDLNGAACWARVINSHFVLQQMTASIMWNLVGAYYHGTNWYASSMLTSVQPWSGHYDTLPVVWATAHVTQFTEIGWRYLAVGNGSGELAQGGYYTTIVDPNGSDFTLQVVKISYDHAPCTRPKLPEFSVAPETFVLKLAPSMKAPKTLTVWKSNFEKETAMLFEKQQDIAVVDNTITLQVAVGDFYTISSVRTAVHGSFSTPVPTSVPQFPLPLFDDMQSHNVSQEAAFFADQIGAFEIHEDASKPGNKVLKQMVPQLPIGWSDHGSNGPMTLIGMREWQDISISVDFRLPVHDASACVGSRVDQMWNDGIVLCVSAAGQWNVTVGGPPQSGVFTHKPIASGTTKAPGVGSWHTLSLTTVGSLASGSLDSVHLATNLTVRDIDTGFGAIGMNEWYAVEFDNFHVKQAGHSWTALSPCGAAKAGDVLKARPCQRNGLAAQDQSFELLSDWQLRHMPSGLCAEAESSMAGSPVRLSACNFTDDKQKFKNDYTRVRNTVEPFSLVSSGGGKLLLTGNVDGSVSIASPEPDQVHGGSVSSIAAQAHGKWSKWASFPNTNQLRCAASPPPPRSALPISPLVAPLDCPR